MKTSKQEKTEYDRMFILQQNDSKDINKTEERYNYTKQMESISEMVSANKTEFSTKDRETREVSVSKLSLTGKQKEQRKDQIESNSLMNNFLRDI